MNRDILIGMGGWSLPAFDGPFYPAEQPKGFRKLEYYSRFFDLVEVNATFYTTSLGPQQARRWIREVEENKGFTFTVKLFQGFTHKFNATQGDVKAVKALLEPLAEAEKLGGLILQFPHSFVRTPENEAYLQKLSRTFESFALFVEFRHDSWNSDEVFRFIEDAGLQLLNTDLPEIKHHMPFTNVASGDSAYYRLMGRNKASWDKGGVTQRYNYFYSEEELRDLLQRISQLKSTVRKAFVVFHNDPHAHSPVNGFQLKHMAKPTARVTAPSSLITAFPQLKAFCDPPIEPVTPRPVYRVSPTERRRKEQ